jgi:hypothetical protein
MKEKYFQNDGQNDLEKEILKFLEQCPHGLVNATLHEAGKVGGEFSNARPTWKIDGKQSIEALATELAEYIEAEYKRGERIYRGATVRLSP